MSKSGSSKKIDMNLGNLETGQRDLNVRFDILEKRFDEHEEKEEKRYNKLMENLTWLVKMFKKFDEEHTVLSHRASDHDDRIERLEKSVYKN